MTIFNREDPRAVLPQLEKRIDEIVNVVYPIGSYYETSDAKFDPNKEWLGTWELDSGRWHRIK